MGFRNTLIISSAMVCCNSSRNRSINDGSKTVLSKLIIRVEKRKSMAENFLVYALLQSTVERLKTDSCMLDKRKSKVLFKERRNFGDEQISKLNSCSVSEQKCSNQNSSQNSEDPLKLDEFFSRLKS